MTASASPRREIDGKIFVTDVYDGGPAARAGVKAGDEILSVDGKPFAEIGMFKGRNAASAILTLRREAGADPMTMTVPVERLQPSEVAGRGDREERRGDRARRQADRLSPHLVLYGAT